jgi:hypothetical protein
MMIVQSVHYDSFAADFMWNCTPVVNWSAIEVHLSIMAGKPPILVQSQACVLTCSKKLAYLSCGLP